MTKKQEIEKAIKSLPAAEYCTAAMCEIGVKTYFSDPIYLVATDVVVQRAE